MLCPGQLVLGSLNLREGYALTAEKNLLKALEHIPSSISILKNLAQIAYRLEEFEESLAYNDRILSLAPSYRDALLGKAICLSYLGRHDEAVALLNHLIELGMYLMGESHYWLAWNLNETGLLEPAMDNVKRAIFYRALRWLSRIEIGLERWWRDLESNWGYADFQADTVSTSAAACC